MTTATPKAETTTAGAYDQLLAHHREHVPIFYSSFYNSFFNVGVTFLCMISCG